MGLLYLRGRTIQEVGGEMLMGSFIYGVAVIDGSLYSRVYGIHSNSCYSGRVWMPTSRVPSLSSDSCYPLGSPCFIRWEPVKSLINFPVRLAAIYADYTAVVNHGEVDTSKLHQQTTVQHPHVYCAMMHHAHTSSGCGLPLPYE